MLRLLLAAAVLAVVTGQDAVPVPGLSDWCQLPGHASTSACASDATCATGDSWWSDASICKLPGPAGQYPYNVSSYDVCGGPSAVTRVPLVDPSGAQLGEAALFRLYASTQLHVTVALGTNDSAVALYRPADGAGTGALASLFLDQSLLPGPAAQYSSLVPSSGTSPYACFTWSLDLTAVCDPLTSYQSGDGSCVCYSGAQCPPQDLSAEEVLYFFLTLNVTLAQPGADGCRTDTGTVTTLTTSFPAASVPGTGQTGSIPVGPAEGCSQAVMQLYPLYRGAASSFDCRAAPNSLGIGSDLSFRLVFQSYDGLSAFRQGMSDEKTWEGLLGALAVSCGSLGAYEDSLGEAYSVCGAAGEAPACRYVLPALRCAPPPSPPPPPPVPARCVANTTIRRLPPKFVYASCDALLWFNSRMFLPGVAVVSPFRCALAPSRGAVSVTGVLAGPGDAATYLANAGANVETLARYFNLTCSDLIVVDAAACVPEGGVITYTQQSLPASVCPRPPAPPPAPPNPPPPRPPRPPSIPPAPPEFPGEPPPPSSPVSPPAPQQPEPDGGQTGEPGVPPEAPVSPPIALEASVAQTATSPDSPNRVLDLPAQPGGDDLAFAGPPDAPSTPPPSPEEELGQAPPSGEGRRRRALLSRNRGEGPQR
ncbi:hypothetical protein HYH03_009046 [Edaphochlamys debaryana]|uniref:Uncharacterized protein n=1 Tax=Edaphochlamys debaryana TaxID=47281 RepID=A0A835XZ36_9CHLO|nr:hypothetical protein HYH03_009046 [Edaphochlamys debaryana]|eukprot:KAG2492630.1 hypothetical protein HYH03_009046 [Edaphochlamys debaryana]